MGGLGHVDHGVSGEKDQCRTIPFLGLFRGTQEAIAGSGDECVDVRGDLGKFLEDESGHHTTEFW